MKKRFLSLALSAVLALSVLTPAALAAEYVEIVPPKYNGIGWGWGGDDRDGGYDGSSLIPVKLGVKWGFIDANGKEVVPPKYDEIEDFSEGLARVAVDGKWGVIDATGKEVVPPKYDEIEDFSEGLARVKLNEKYGFIDGTGKEVVPLQYNYYPDRKFSGGLAPITVDGKWGFIDATGKMVISPKYSNGNSAAPKFSEGLAAVYVDGKWGFIDATGKEVVPPKYDIVRPFSEGLAAVGADGKWGFIDATGKEVVPPKYVSADAFTEGLAKVGVVNSQSMKYGYIDTTGKEVIPCQYNAGSSVSEGLIAVHSGSLEYGKWGVVDTTGKEILGPTYDKIDDFYDGLARVSVAGRHGYIDTAGREVVPVKYDADNIAIATDIMILRCYEGMVVVRLGREYGCYNAAGQEILPVKYDDISWFMDGFATATLNKACSLIDKTGKEVIPPAQGRTLRHFGNGLVRTYFNGKYGLIRVSTSTPVNPTPAPTVPPSPCAVTLDGKAITLNAYLFTENGGGSNYVMLRDIAMLLNGTKAQFDVSWSADVGITITTGKAYTPVGGELQGKGDGEKGYTANSSTITVDGKPVSLGGYTIESNNYFKLRDLGTALGFTVDWDAATGTVVLSTNG